MHSFRPALLALGLAALARPSLASDPDFPGRLAVSGVLYPHERSGGRDDVADVRFDLVVEDGTVVHSELLCGVTLGGRQGSFSVVLGGSVPVPPLPPGEIVLAVATCPRDTCARLGGGTCGRPVAEMPLDAVSHAFRAQLAGWADEAGTAAHADEADVASRAAEADVAARAARADVADRALSAASAEHALEADVAQTALLVSRASEADLATRALHADVADAAGHASSADRATSAASADFADRAASAEHAAEAGVAARAVVADHAAVADAADHASTAGRADAADACALAADADRLDGLDSTAFRRAGAILLGDLGFDPATQAELDAESRARASVDGMLSSELSSESAQRAAGDSALHDENVMLRAEIDQLRADVTQLQTDVARLMAIVFGGGGFPTR